MKITAEIVNKCILCGGHDLRPLALTLRLNQPHFVRVRCNNCKLVISSPMASAECLSDYYKNYYSSGSHSHLAQTCVKERKKIIEGSASQIREIRRYDTSMGNFLDVGCGSGNICAAARDSGYQGVFGVDLSLSGIDFGKSEYGLENLTCGELHECAHPNDFFDVVHCWHLIEHVRNPMALLKEINRILKPNGVLYWGTDNHHSIGYIILRFLCHISQRFPPIYDGIEHTFGFDPSTIKKALNQTGFESTYIHAYPDQFNMGELIGDFRDGGLTKAFRTSMQSIFRIKMKGVARKVGTV